VTVTLYLLLCVLLPVVFRYSGLLGKHEGEGCGLLQHHVGECDIGRGFAVDGVVDKFQPVTSTIMLEDMNHTEILQADTL